MHFHIMSVDTLFEKAYGIWKSREKVLLVLYFRLVVEDLCDFSVAGTLSEKGMISCSSRASRTRTLSSFCSSSTTPCWVGLEVCSNMAEENAEGSALDPAEKLLECCVCLLRTTT
jgi:hypothetical protein